MEFLGYARQVVQQMELLESKYIDKKPEKQRFCVSTQHYTFTTNAFVELIQRFGNLPIIRRNFSAMNLLKGVLRSVTVQRL